MSSDDGSPSTDNADAVEVLEFPTIDLDPLETAVSRCNRLFAFAPQLKPDDTMLAAHKQMEEEIEDAVDALERAQKKLKRVANTLHELTMSTAVRLPSLLSGDHWYEETDLLFLSDVDVRHMLASNPPKDMACFSAYIERTLHANVVDFWQACTDTAEDEELPERNPTLRKAGKVAGFHLLVWAKIDLLRIEDRAPVSEDDAIYYSRLVNQAIERLLLRQANYGYEFPFSGAFPNYYNVARARCDLYAEWHDSDCSESGFGDSIQVHGNAQNADPCWHGHNADLMVALNKAAYREIKQNV
ncbi:hypothetical protein LTR17_002591 [Elasticomyces elasticus]|nr:hypothetical protein LTR17_002591 [Elasticomyces elasticus]